MPRQLSDLGDPLARIHLTHRHPLARIRIHLTGYRHSSFGTDTLRFQNGFQPNLPLHHPNFVEALETLYLIKE